MVVACAKCGLRMQYDKAAMLEAGGDRKLTYLLDEIVRRGGCSKMDAGPNIYDRCGAAYEGLVEMLKASGRF